MSLSFARLRIWLLLALLMVVAAFGYSRVIAGHNGFDLSESTIPAEKILPGGPPKDGIPSIDNPVFESAAQASWLKAEDRVLGLAYNGHYRAYPLAILNWHEVVNDEVAGDPVTITYCPLCGTGVAYKSLINGKRVEFGVSGLLYNSDVLLYDRESQSLWSQLKHQAISGPMKGTALDPLPLQLAPWKQWREKYPQTQVLSRDTGHHRDYSRSPYADYDQNQHIYFPVEFLSKRYHPKERVLGLQLAGGFKAYPFAELAKLQAEGEAEFSDSFNGIELTVRFNAQQRTGQVFHNNGNEIPVVNSFWFAWYGFHPQTDIFIHNP